jgi:arylsulfatase A-like enzyme
MKRELFPPPLNRVVTTLLLVLLVAATSSSCGPEPPPPNVVLISLDTLRADHVGTYGYPKATTPNLDRLAATGIVFLNNYAQAPNTAPSHTSILASLYPSVASIWDHGGVLDPNVPMLAETFKDAGFSTAAFVQLPSATYERGFDVYTGLSHGASFRRRAESTMESVREWVSAQTEQPFFLFLHTYAVHLPYSPSEELAEKFDPDYGGPLSNELRAAVIDQINDGELEIDEADLEHIVAMYDAEIAELDQDLGALFSWFEENGLLENTVFAVISDHGEEFGEHGIVAKHTYSLHQELIHTPLILFGGGIPGGIRVEQPSRNVDVAPTLLRLANIELPAHYQGADLRPVWEGTERRPRVVLAEKRDYKVFLEGGFKYYTNGQLYDLGNDPYEKENLVDARPELTQRFEELATAWQAELDRLSATIAQGGEIRLSPEEVRRLKALGYIQ